MMATPIGALELHYSMIHFLINYDIPSIDLVSRCGILVVYSSEWTENEKGLLDCLKMK